MTPGADVLAAQEEAAKLARSREVHGAGTIIRVGIRNLRTHKNLELKLSSRVNFIVGDNGSGKSTVLLAVALALGADISTKLFKSADKDERESKKNPIIRDGETLAEVEVDVRNEGVDAYERDTYGRVVRIVRQMELLPSGSISSTFTMSNLDTGKVIFKSPKGVKAHTFPPLVALVDALNISPSNPTVVMDQEMAKVILQSSGAVHYKHFISATGLNRAYAALVDTNNKLIAARKNIQAGKATLALREDELSRASRMLDKIRGFSELERLVADAIRDVEWAKLRQPEKALADAAEAVRTLQAQQKEMNETLEKALSVVTDKINERDAKQCVEAS